MGRSRASQSKTQQVDLSAIRTEMANEYANALTLSNPSEGRVEFFAARVHQMDQLLKRESADRPRGSVELEKARADILQGLVTRIKHRPTEDLSSYYQRLDQIDALIATGGVPAPRPAGVPPAPSLKPALPQL